MAVIGIDLGTTNSLACVWTEEGVQLIPNSLGEYLTPSVVSFDDKGTVYVGKIAREMLVTHPKSTFQEFKRYMGTKRVYAAAGEHANSYTPQELSAFILRQLKFDAENFLHEPVEEAIISVPAYFNDNQRCATRDAGKIAGLKVERLINEPSAAALAYHTDNSSDHQIYVVFDFGGGTLDVSVVEAFGNIVEIQAVAGDNHLGGKDFNKIIVNYFYQQSGLDEQLVSEKIKAHIYQEAELCKMKLTEQDEVRHKIYVDGKEYELYLTNQMLIQLSGDLFRGMSKIVERALNNCSMSLKDIDSVILAGGSSKMPVVRHFVEKIFNKKAVCGINPDECVAKGAGIVAGIKSRNEKIKDVILSDICPFSLGTELHDGSFSVIIERNEILPCSRSNFYTTFRDNQRKLNIRVYQGDSLVAKENLLITGLEIEIPPKPAGQIRVEVKYTYDINGILEIDLTCEDNGKEVHKVVVNENIGLSEREIAEKKAALQKLKVHPREKDENKLILMRAQHLYEELGAEEREILMNEYNLFVQALDTQRESVIRQAYVKFTLYLEILKHKRGVQIQYDDDFWDEQDEE